MPCAKSYRRSEPPGEHRRIMKDTESNANQSTPVGSTGMVGTQRVHVIPVGHPEPLHHCNMQCWCHPLPKEGGEIAIHNAKDGREKWERQGILDSDKRWALAYEDVPTDEVRDRL